MQLIVDFIEDCPIWFWIFMMCVFVFDVSSSMHRVLEFCSVNEK